MQRVHCGAYVKDPMTNGCDDRVWQPWHRDPDIRVEWTKDGMTIRGTSSLEERAFTGVTTRRLYDPDAYLSADMKISAPLDADGKYGTVCHLCNCLLGDEVSCKGLPDNNAEATYGRNGEVQGWFFWYYDHSSGDFHKWVDGQVPVPARGDEATAFRTVRVRYDAASQEASAELLEAGAWLRLGAPVRLHKLFSNIELKVDCRRSGIEFHSTYRNVRLHPRPSTHPLRLFAGTPEPAQGLIVRLLLDDESLSEGLVGADGLATLELKDEWNYPLPGALEVLRGGTVVDEIRHSGAEGMACDGIYPGDFFAADPEKLKQT